MNIIQKENKIEVLFGRNDNVPFTAYVKSQPYRAIFKKEGNLASMILDIDCQPSFYGEVLWKNVVNFIQELNQKGTSNIFVRL